MKKILLGMIALLAFVFTAQADNIVSGQKYKIVSLDGTKALSCGSKAANDVKLTMNALSDTEQGQVWVFNQMVNIGILLLIWEPSILIIHLPTTANSKTKWCCGIVVAAITKSGVLWLPMMIATTWFLLKMLINAMH